MRRHNLQYHISTWVSNNMLKTNQDKTDIIIFRPKQQVNTSHDMSITVGGNTICRTFFISEEPWSLHGQCTHDGKAGECCNKVQLLSNNKHRSYKTIYLERGLQSSGTESCDFTFGLWIWHPTDITWAFAASSELCCAPHRQNSQKGAHITCVVPTSLAACTL